MQAWERADTQALTTLLREDACWAMPPARLWFEGKAAITTLFTLFPNFGEWRVPPAADRGESPTGRGLLSASTR